MNEKGERLMFGLFHKKEQKALELGAPVSGQAVPLQEVSDPTFGGEILGKGVAVRPTDGRIYAPADGEITLLFDTLHALSMTTDTGAELLLHIGLDTVALKGAHFKAHVKTGDKVRKGDLLLEADLNAIREAGYDVITPMIVCNTDCFAEVKAVTGAEVTPQDTVGILTGAFRYKIKGQIIYGIVRKSTVPEKEGGRSYDEISSEVRKSIDASGCLPADLRYLNGNRICTLPGNHAGW